MHLPEIRRAATDDAAGEAAASRFEPFAKKMRAAGLDELSIGNFEHQFKALLQGATGLIPGDVAGPVPDAKVARLSALADEYSADEALLDQVVLIKLNGGLGTSMGLRGPKSLIPVKKSFHFLDIACWQVRKLRERHAARLPLILMNSFRTREQSLAALEKHPGIEADLAKDFLQSKVPKIQSENLLPAGWPADPDLEWCPPGHGDVYSALYSSGSLKRMLESGYRYAFISNIDNLGASLSQAILGYMAASELPFLMEVAERTLADRKGGHLACRPDGQLILRESAQCPPDETSDFQDIQKYAYFNTNNLWVDLERLHQTMQASDGHLLLPMIRNQKNVDPTDPDSPSVYQLETAMGSAISRFHGAEAVLVGRDRFHPVKKCDDLLGLWSDAYRLSEAWRMELATEFEGAPLIQLDPRFYSQLDQLRERFSEGAPSLRSCRSLSIEGDIYFGHGVQLSGEVALAAESEPAQLEAGLRLDGKAGRRFVLSGSKVIEEQSEIDDPRT